MDIKERLVDVIEMAKNMVLSPLPTASAFKKNSPDMREILERYAGPAIIGSSLTVFLLSILTARYGFTLSGLGSNVYMTVMQIVFSFVSLFVFATVFSALAKRFGGQDEFEIALGGVTICSLPYMLASLSNAVPLFGIIVMFFASLHAIYLMYLVMPKYLRIPEERALTYFAVAMLCSIVAATILSFLVFSPITIINPSS